MFKRWQRVGSRPLLHRRGAAGSAPTAPRRYPQAILDPIWQALNIGRDNEGLLLAQAGRIINVNPLLLQLCGRSLSELVGREVASELFAPSLTASRWESLLKTAVGEPIAIEITRQEFAADLGQFEVYAVRDLAREQALESQARHSRALQQREAQGASRQVSEHFTELADGRYIAVSIQPMANGGMVMTHQDITEQRRSEAKIAHMALHDALTNLPNRVLLNERLEHTLFRSRRGEMVATHILDLDHFKHLNDTLGHPAGDKLLQMVANRLRALVRNTDTVARMGGDGFAIVRVALAQIVDATSLAQRVITALSEPYDIDGQQVMIGTSVGITLAPSDGLLPEQLIRNGDLALYRAKGDGRGTFRFFEAEMDVRMQTRRPLEQDLRKAVVAGELELHFQPVINIASGKISCLEALVRWQHPQDGLVSPATFIPLAEETGLIVPIGEWVIRQACATAARWPADLKLAVNLSPAQLRNPGLPQMLISALAASGLAPDRLELEITETVLLHDSAATLAILFRLRELGVRIAMDDDFGTGYSSLNRSQRFPFDKIKIDRSFINNIAADVSSLNIVRAVAALANGLGVAATAEGVETREQFDLIRSEGCTEMQGFLLSKPVSAHELEPLFLANGIECEGASLVAAA